MYTLLYYIKVDFLYTYKIYDRSNEILKVYSVNIP